MSEEKTTLILLVIFIILQVSWIIGLPRLIVLVAGFLGICLISLSLLSRYPKVRLLWVKLRAKYFPGSDLLGVKSIKLRENAVLIESSGHCRAIAGVKFLSKPFNATEGDRIRDFLSGLQKAGIPCFYTLCLRPIESGDRRLQSMEKEIEKLRNSDSIKGSLEARQKRRELQTTISQVPYGFLESNLFMFTWADGDADRVCEEVREKVRSLLASIYSSFPGVKAEIMKAEEVLLYLRSFFTKPPSQIA